MVCSINSEMSGLPMGPLMTNLSAIVLILFSSSSLRACSSMVMPECLLTMFMAHLLVPMVSGSGLSFNIDNANSVYLRLF